MIVTGITCQTETMKKNILKRMERKRTIQSHFYSYWQLTHKMSHPGGSVVIAGLIPTSDLYHTSIRIKLDMVPGLDQFDRISIQSVHHGDIADDCPHGNDRVGA
jgi:hypothetical protein